MESEGAGFAKTNLRWIKWHFIIAHSRFQYSTSCEAADVVKPKARLCEPWITSKQNLPKPRSGDQPFNGTVALVLTRNPHSESETEMSPASQAPLIYNGPGFPRLAELLTIKTWVTVSYHDIGDTFAD